MCVVSMVMDHYRERWEPLTYPVLLPLMPPPQPPWQVTISRPSITAEEIAEFRRLLERAREYDKRHGEPDCELDEKKQALLAIAAKLGIEIGFL